MSFVVCRNGEPVPTALRGAVVAIGNFDGVHQGHRALIAVARSEAERLRRPSAVFTFEPHPQTFFKPDLPLFRLTPEGVKLSLLERSGLDGAFVQPFDRMLAALSAEAFVAEFLALDRGVSGVVAGYDFHFGRGREGDPARLQDLCRAHGLSCTILSALTRGDQIVSSTAIRAALECGDVARANDLLGYGWFIHAEVRHGDKRGRTLGYPTANLRLEEGCRLRYGIYAVRAASEGRILDGVASFGRRPTFDNGAPLLEVHLFDFDGDLYRRPLDVEVVGWIRGEERFESAQALVARMNRDSEEARGILAADRTPSMIA